MSEEPRQNLGRGLVDRKLVEAPPPPSNFIAGRPNAALLFWFFMVILLSICLWYVSIVGTCIAVHSAVCHALYNNKNKKIGKNRCLVVLHDLVLFCSVILSLLLLCLMNQGRTKGEGWSNTN